MSYPIIIQPTCTESACPVIVTSDCVIYTGVYLPKLNVSPNDDLTSILAKIEVKIGDSSSLVSYAAGSNYVVGDQRVYDSKIWQCINQILGAPVALDPSDWEIIINEEFSGTTLERQALTVFYGGQAFWDTDLMLPLYFVAPNWYNSAGGITI